MPTSQVQGLLCWPFDPITISPTVAPSGTRAMTSERDPTTTDAGTSPIRTAGLSSELRDRPRMVNSPPGIAAFGVTSRISGEPSEVCRFAMSVEVEIPRQVQDYRAVHPCHEVVGHDARSFGQLLELPDRR